MTQHTPGPWHTRKNDASITAEAPNGTASTVAHVDFSKSRDEWVSNARLIAASPELLDALIEIYERLAADIPVEVDDSWFSVARAAIAKAKGETA
jgi:hypothetical protein